ncbi:Capsular biosynthesis protein [Leuconostoc gasicomitatum]|uniref:capsular polysaccharide synthesis protein n=1 Tax=Leuconostoc gelidum group TaxID=3016637 RepID=UPI00027E6A30|nr:MULTISPECIES: capsular polysaccharide synthesis protein [Leuconostoc gelidum group]AFS40122.1 glycosyl transferase [Leuconostoc gelidum JB7]MBZ5952071.1 capsular polysaccharide synthesis protein [Leuconostoc gasicomitatum]MBZ5968238.1 capsular polysaccharide synthesis protein [Leuconostoc gasicomitatum]QDJ30123.1 hypothetical protein BHS02_05515 [Leuconostoc gelidum subsp. gelidum]SOC02204.1 Glycosyl transferase [Leuconostoc gasicomitatum]
MSELKKAIRKFGKGALIRGYIRTHTLWYIFLSFLINGSSKQGLELVRLGQQLKVKKLLYKRYKGIINNPIIENNIQQKSNYVWICWFQGIEQAPDIVKVCVESIVESFTEREVILVTKNNIANYVEIPDYMVNKWHDGKITDTHFSDILRAELLTKHGGIWIDATVFVSHKDYLFEKVVDNSDLFFFQKLKPGGDGNAIIMSSWFISCKKNNPILTRTRDLLREYWKKNDKLLDYFLFHFFLQLVLDKNKLYYDAIPKYDSGVPHILLSRLNDTYCREEFENICDRVSINKLSYKNIDTNKDDTFYAHFIEMR